MFDECWSLGLVIHYRPQLFTCFEVWSPFFGDINLLTCLWIPADSWWFVVEVETSKSTNLCTTTINQTA